MTICKRRHLVPEIPLFEIITAVSNVYGVSYSAIRGDGNSSELYDARCMCVYLIFYKTKSNMRKISSHFENMQMQKVINAKTRMRKMLNTDNISFGRMEKVLSLIG